MTLSDESDKPDLGRLRQSDALCDEFEAACQQGRPAELAHFVGRVAAHRRPDLLRALLPLDLEYRADAGETPRPADYAALWPEHSALIDELFRATVLERKIDPPASEHKPDSGTCRADQPSADILATLCQTEEPAEPPALPAAPRIGESTPPFESWAAAAWAWSTWPGTSGWGAWRR